MSLPAALPRPAALIFDLDGTLVDTAPDLARATNELRQHHGLPPLEYEVIRAEVSHGGSALVTLALGHDLDHPEHAAERTRLLDFYARDVAAHSVLFPGYDALIEACQRSGLPWGIVTNKPRQFAEPLIAALELTPGCLLCADDLPVKKPHPEPLFEAARRLDAAAGECWYLGDHDRDMQAARAAGMLAVAVRYGYVRDGDDVDAWPADVWFDTSEEVVNAALRAAGLH